MQHTMPSHSPPSTSHQQEVRRLALRNLAQHSTARRNTHFQELEQLQRFVLSGDASSAASAPRPKTAAGTTLAYSGSFVRDIVGRPLTSHDIKCDTKLQSSLRLLKARTEKRNMVGMQASQMPNWEIGSIGRTFGRTPSGADLTILTAGVYDFTEAKAIRSTGRMRPDGLRRAGSSPCCSYGPQWMGPHCRMDSYRRPLGPGKV